MAEKRPILDLEFWRKRLFDARRGELHHAVYVCPKAEWDAICERHRKILAETIRPTDKILDCGCGWGRLLDLMPLDWHMRSLHSHQYLGVDLSPDFIQLAKELRPQHYFLVGDLRRLHEVTNGGYDIAVLISVRGMVIRELGRDVWNEMEIQIRKVAKRLLYLEYTPGEDEGRLE